MFRLALALGKTVGELECNMSHSEFVEWQHFNRFWPIGERRTDLHFAQVCNLIANALGAKTSINDWMLKVDPDEPERDVDDEISDDDLRATFGSNVRRIKR